MNTSRTISNISYNTPLYFESVVNRLFSGGVIEWCYWILHQPDTDETKAHIHFVLRPSSRIDTSKLRAEFLEIDLSESDKPLSPTTKWFLTSSLDDWLLYVVHDSGYLASKGQVRNIHYQFADICSTDADALRNDWCSINFSKYDRLRRLQDAVNNHIPFAVLVQQGVVPISQRSCFEAQYNDLVRLSKLAKTGRLRPHEIDENGEINEIQGFTQFEIDFPTPDDLRRSGDIV